MPAFLAPTQHTPVQLEEVYRSVPGKKERSEAVGALRQLARDQFVHPQLWQRVQQLEGGTDSGGELLDGAPEQQGGGAGQNGQPGTYDYATVSMALKASCAGMDVGFYFWEEWGHCGQL